MKRALLILIALCGLNSMGNAQAISQKEVFASSPLNSSIALVRSHGSNHSIVYGVDYTNNPLGDHQLFLCSNISFYVTPPIGPGAPFFNYHIDLPGNIILNVYDMRVLGNYTYLCGKTQNHEGFIGWVDNADFFSSSFTFYYVPIPEVSFVNKMVVYDDYSANPKAVAIGVHDYTDLYGNHRDYHAIELDNASLPSASYRHINLGEYDVLHEVLYSFIYGVIFIEYTVNNNALAIRKADPSAVVTTSLIQTLYYYPTGDNEVYSPTHSAIDKDSLAVSYLFGKYGTSHFTTRIRYFDLATLSMNNSQEYAILDKSEPYDMVYCFNGSHWTPIIIQPDYSGVGPQSYFITLEPGATTSYSTKYYYYPGETYMSADRFPSGNDYVAVGHDLFQYLQNASFAYTSPLSCIIQNNMKIGIIPSVQQYVDETPLSDDPGIGGRQPESALGNITESAITDCYDD